MSALTLVPRRTAGRFLTAITICLIVIAALALLNVVRGAPNVGLDAIWRAISTPASDDRVAFLIRELRVPRVLLGVVCGVALGMVGVLLQDSLRNPLADPDLLGIAQGASFALAVAAIFPEALPDLARPVLCLVAGLLAGGIVIAFSGTIRDPVRVVLAGVVCSAFFATLTTVVLMLAPFSRTNGLTSYFRYVTGSVSAAQWSQLGMVAPWLAIGIPAALLSGRALNLLQLGDDLATGAGLNPFRARLVLILIAMVLVSPVIAAVGPIAFVALFAPHIARGVLRSSDARQVLIVSALSGAALLLAADTVGRLLFFPAEIPAGIWTVAMVGPAAIAVVGRMAGRRVAS